LIWALLKVFSALPGISAIETIESSYTGCIGFPE
jgi:hypothetical protein